MAQGDTEGADLDVLHPERALTVGGRAVTVREYSFIEGLRIQQRVRPIVAGLEAAAEGGDVSMDVLDELVARHTDDVLALVAQACDQPVEWVRGLSDEDGQALLLAWWGVCSRFFIRRLVMRRAWQAAQQPAGATSTPASSTTATAGASSDATPGAS